MIYSNACAYGIRALSQLAMIRPDGYVLLDELCEGTDLPRHFVAKIFQDLVRHSLLTSAKGRGGGFALAMRPDRITLYDIVEAIDGVAMLTRCAVGMALCDDEQPCPHHVEWAAVREHIRSFLEETTLEQMGTTLEKKLEQLGHPRPEPKSKSKPVRGVQI